MLDITEEGAKIHCLQMEADFVTPALSVHYSDRTLTYVSTRVVLKNTLVRPPLRHFCQFIIPGLKHNRNVLGFA